MDSSVHLSGPTQGAAFSWGVSWDLGPMDTQLGLWASLSVQSLAYFKVLAGPLHSDAVPGEEKWDCRGVKASPHTESLPHVLLVKTSYRVFQTQGLGKQTRLLMGWRQSQITKGTLAERHDSWGFMDVGAGSFLYQSNTHLSCLQGYLQTSKLI